MSAGWEAWLHGRPIAVIATTGPDGVPHAVPVEVVVEGSMVYTWCRRTAARVRHLEHTPSAAVVAYKGNDFVLVRGRARLVDEADPVYGPVTARFLEKYAREETYGNDVLIAVSPDRVTARGIDA